MTQDRGEPVREFAARLRGQAEVACTGCGLLLNQGEERVVDRLCIGLADAEIQEDLLKHSNQDMGVKETIRFVEIRVAEKRSAVSMTTPTTTSAIDEHEGGEAIASNYRRQQRRPTARARQEQAKTTPTRHLSTPTSHTQPKIQSHPNQRAISTRQGSHTYRATPANRAPSAARQDTESKRGRPTGAQHSAPPARHVEG